MQIILDTHFKNIELFTDEVHDWDLDFRLLSNGGFRSSIKQLVSHNVLLSHVLYHGRLDQVGATPAGYRTFVILGDTSSDFMWRRHQITQNDLLIFPDSNEFYCASQSDFEVFTISIHIDYLEQLMDDFGLNKIPNKQEVVRMDAHVAQELRNLATTITRSSGDEVTQILAHELAEKLVVTAVETCSNKTSHIRMRDIAIDKVIEFIRNTSTPTSELARLCQIANVSERTLQYAFKERYGIAPNTFVKQWNLNTARRKLLLANPKETTINKICMELNFLHQSQFTADYKKLFDELPSKTLNRL